MMKRSHLVAHKDSFDGNVQVLAPVNQIKFDHPTPQLLKKGGGLMCIPFPPFGGGGSPTCSPFPNKCPIISIAKGDANRHKLSEKSTVLSCSAAKNYTNEEVFNSLFFCLGDIT